MTPKSILICSKTCQKVKGLVGGEPCRLFLFFYKEVK